MKWGLKLFCILDCLTFLIFISPKLNYLFSTFKFSFSIADNMLAIWEIVVLLLFLLSGYLLWFKPKSGLFCSFILIPFRFVFLYFSFDFLSYLTYYLGFKDLVSTVVFQDKWYFVLLALETLRYLYSIYIYYKISIAEE
jgi:hypothetical protein